MAYRGEGISKDILSWTLSKKTAEFFAKRFGNKGKVLYDKIKLNNIMDYLQKDYWNEDEKRMNSYHDVISMHAYIAYRVMDIERKKELKKT